MGKMIAHARMGGVCYSCGNAFRRGDQIWWAGYNRARHPGCMETNTNHPNWEATHGTPGSSRTAALTDVNAQPANVPSVEYLFVDPKGSSKFDQLFFSNPGDMLVRAFEISLEQECSVGVSRIEDGKAVALFLIAASKDASLVPVPKPVETTVDGPLFPWEGDKAPF